MSGSPPPSPLVIPTTRAEISTTVDRLWPEAARVSGMPIDGWGWGCQVGPDLKLYRTGAMNGPMGPARTAATWRIFDRALDALASTLEGAGYQVERGREGVRVLGRADLSTSGTTHADA